MPFEKVCPCGKRFTADVRKRKYCSRGCVLRYSKPVRDVVCTKCGITFTFHGRGRRLYCGTCKKKVNVEKVIKSRVKVGLLRKPGVGRGGNQRGNRNGLKNKTGVEEALTNYRKRCLDLWGKNCVLCSSNSYIEYHHVDGDAGNYETSNIIPLCRRCHRSLHAAVRASSASIEDILFAMWKDGRIKIAEKTGTPRGGQSEVKA